MEALEGLTKEDLRDAAVYVGVATAAYGLCMLVLFVYFTFDGTMGIGCAPRYGLTRLRVFIRTYLWPYRLLGYQRPVRGMQRQGFRRNCLAPHVPLMLHKDFAAARQDPRDFAHRSPWRVTLDHEDAWEFVLEPSKFTSRGKDFVKGEAMGKVHRVPVPSNWQLQGFQAPLYTNFRYPFGTAYPHLKMDNPCGYYRRQFLVPSRWVDEYRRIRLCLMGAGPDVEVHLNGKSVGYSQDSMTPSEFDISDAVYRNVEENGSYDNSICLEICRFAEGSWLEDQDHWWFSGIHRSIEIQGLPRVHMYDYTVTTEFVAPETDATPRSLADDVLRTDVTDATQGEVVGTRAAEGAKEVPGEYQDVEVLGYGGSRAPLLPVKGNVYKTSAGVDDPSLDHNVLDAERMDVLLKVEFLVAVPADQRGPVGPDAAKTAVVRATLYDGAEKLCELQGKSDGSDPGPLEAPPGYPEGYANGSLYTRMSLEGRVQSPRKWSAERPALYTLILELADGDGDTAEPYQVEGLRVGFREVHIKKGVLHLNGRPVVVAGANRHEHDPYTGKCVTEESMRRDLALLKQHNFNASRNCHYPNNHRWYELCDEHGIMVCDEANTESHGFVLAAGASMAMCDPRFQAEVVGRVAAMFERSKNHACVCSLSLGNECGYGPTTLAARKWLRPRTTLPIQYENGVSDGDCAMMEGDGRQPLVTDFICPMYDSPAQLAEMALGETKPAKDNVLERRRGERPLICCEYGHAMGNSGGNLNVYWDLIWSADEAKGHQRIQGGYIWDFVDQGLTVPKTPLPDGVLNGPGAVAQWREERSKGGGAMPDYFVQGAFGYGGSFGPDSGTMDRQFCCNGLNFPDRTPHPTMEHLKQLMAPVRFRDVDPAQLASGARELHFRVENRYSFRSLAHLSFRYRIRVGDNAGPILEGNARVPRDPDEFPVFPGDDAEISVEVGDVLQRYAKGVWMELQAVQKVTICGSPAGHVVCERVYELKPVPVAQMVLKEMNNAGAGESASEVQVNYDEATHELVASAPGEYRLRFLADGSGTFSLKTGASVSPALTQFLKYSFFRAPTDNDQGGAELLFPEVGKGYRFFPEAMRLNFSFNTQWRGMGLHDLTPTVVDASFDASAKSFSLTEQHKNSWGETLFTTTTQFNCRRTHVAIASRVEPAAKLNALPTLPRIGLELTLPADEFGPAAGLVWCGGGPNENYADRKTGYTGVFGPLKLDGRDGGKSGGGLTTPYIYPSESGNRSDVRWVAAVDPSHRTGILVAHGTNDPDPDPVAPASGMGQWKCEDMPDEEAKADPRYAGKRKRRPAGTTPGTFTLGASRYAIDEVYWVKHQCDLPQVDTPIAKAKRNEDPDVNNVPMDCVFRPVRLRIDTAHMGLGGDTSWVPQTHDQFLIHPMADGTRTKPGAWTFTTCLQPVPEDVLEVSGPDQDARIKERVYAMAVGSMSI